MWVSIVTVLTPIALFDITLDLWLPVLNMHNTNYKFIQFKCKFQDSHMTYRAFIGNPVAHEKKENRWIKGKRTANMKSSRHHYNENIILLLCICCYFSSHYSWWTCDFPLFRGNNISPHRELWQNTGAEQVHSQSYTQTWCQRSCNKTQNCAQFIYTYIRVLVLFLCVRLCV